MSFAKQAKRGRRAAVGESMRFPVFNVLIFVSSSNYGTLPDFFKSDKRIHPATARERPA
jgi:hypothetical protein